MKKILVVLFLFSNVAMAAGSDIWEPVRMPDGKVLKCITTPTGTFCY